MKKSVNSLKFLFKIKANQAKIRIATAKEKKEISVGIRNEHTTR